MRFLMKKKEKKRTLIYLTVFVIILVLGIRQAILAQAKQPQAQDKIAGKQETQNKKNRKKKIKKVKSEEMVTATMNRKDTFEIPKPVSVVNRQKILEKASNNIADLLTELPGLDVSGVGVNQVRPVIRGFRGQRLLLLEDGIPMNNSLRERDFGEIPALVDISQVERVEIVRGPASVLYGSDAVGGVVNIITKFPGYNLEGTEIHGSIGYRYSSADSQNKGTAYFNGHLGKLVFSLSGNYRKAGDYQAPAGTFGYFQLEENLVVNDTGVKDGGFNLMLNYNFSKHRYLTFKYQYYRAEDAGFGFVEPENYAIADPDDPDKPDTYRFRPRYPLQELQKYTLKFRDKALGFVLADNLSFTAYYSMNKRELILDHFIPFGITGLPDAGIELRQENFTDMATLGLRLEFNKAVKNHLFTYGFDLFWDNTENADTNISRVVGFGTLEPVIDSTPLVPNATYRSMGVFLQDDISLFAGTSLILGVRYQNVNARTKDTPGIEGEPLVDSADQTVVGAADLVVGVTDHLKLILSIGRGFRSPNLIERFFNGLTPAGSEFQSGNPDLKAETSLNFDIGFKYRWKRIYLESFYFNNLVYDGIQAALTDETVNGIPVYRYNNVDKLLIFGFEVSGKYYFAPSFSFTANYSRLHFKNLTDPGNTYHEKYYDKFNFTLHFHHPKKYFWLGYHLGINSYWLHLQSRDNSYFEIFPGFLVHNLSGGLTLFKNSSFPMRLGIMLGNVTDTLYSAFYNVDFFRPAPKRYLVFTWSIFF